MRKAQFNVDGVDGAAEVVFFHFGKGQGGSVQANIDRWLGQFAEPKDQLHAKTEKKTVAGREITHVFAEGTYLSGPPFGSFKHPGARIALRKFGPFLGCGRQGHFGEHRLLPELRAELAYAAMQDAVAHRESVGGEAGADSIP